MFRMEFKLLVSLLLLFVPSISYYINTHDSIHNITAQNGYHYQVYYQPGYCASPNDIYDPNEHFKVQINVQHECLPSQSLAFTFDRVVFCMYPSKFINCTNTFTGVNETKHFKAYITMTSTTNSSNNVAVTQTINVTWSARKTAPDKVESIQSPDWPIYVGIGFGGVTLIYICIAVIKKVWARKKGYTQMITS